MVEVDEDSMVRRKRDLYRQVAIGVHVFKVVKQVLKPAWPWSKKRVTDLLDYDPQMSESDCGVLLALPAGALEILWSV